MRGLLCLILGLAASSSPAARYSMSAIRPGDADNPQVVEAHEHAGKYLGEDARDLVFIPITPCTVWDSRYATTAPFAGAIGDGVTRQFYSHLDGAGGSFVPYGGNPSCPETAQDAIGGRPYAVMMTVYVNNPVGDGWLTFYRDGDPDASTATLSVYYSTGPTRTQTVIAKSSRGYGTGAYDIAVTGRWGTAHASASVTGYFIKPQSTPITCYTEAGPGAGGIGVPFPSGTDHTFGGPLSAGCAPGFTRVALKCRSLNPWTSIPVQSVSTLECRWRNESGYSTWTGNFLAEAVCCWFAGRW